MKAMDMKTSRVPVSNLKFAPYNPRIMDDKTLNMLKENIKFYKCYEPLMVNPKTWHVIGGNQRLRALIELGYTEVEIVLIDLSLEHEKQLNISLNKISGRFNEPKLAEIFIELQKLPDFKLELTGFEPAELSQILDRFNETKEDDYDFAAAVESIKNPITQKGDIVTLGKHKLMCGDATNPEDLNKLLAGEEVALLDIDWPYNVNYMGGSCPRVDTRPKKSRRWTKIYSDNLPQDQYEAFMRKVLVNIKPYLKPGAVFYQWQAHRQLGPLYQILHELDFYVSCLICWAKESAAISYADYSFQTEQAIYGWLKGRSHYFAGKPGSSNLWSVRRDHTQSYIHPCQKPQALAEMAIKNSTRRNAAVLDCFLGSASVLSAAEVLDRRCFGMELDAKFCDAIIYRYLKYAPHKVSEEVRKRYLKED
jgi:DNA modification methylase